MNKHKMVLVFVVLFMASFQMMRAQASIYNLRMTITPTTPLDMNFPGADTLSNPMVLADSVHYHCYFDISTLFNVDKIIVKLATTSGSSDLVNATFEETGSGPSGMSLTIQEGNAVMYLGALAYHSPVFLEARLLYIDGSMSNPVNLIY